MVCLLLHQKMKPESYAGDGKVYSKRVALTDVAWIDAGEGQYAPVGDDVSYSGTTTDERITFDDVNILRSIGRKSINDFSNENIIKTEK